jgi:hypothetical protein
MKITKFIVITIATLFAVGAFAGPPAPTVPTEGACAGLLKKSSLVTFPASEVEAVAGTFLGTPMVTLYLDFDNNLAYMTGTGESAATASGEEDRTSTELYTLLNGEVFTASVALAPQYAIEVEVATSLESPEGGDVIKLLLVPTNAGTTFFVQDTDGLFSGVCQKV